MVNLILNTCRNIGLGIFVNGAFALQFGADFWAGIYAVSEGVAIMLIAGFGELKFAESKKG